VAVEKRRFRVRLFTARENSRGVRGNLPGTVDVLGTARIATARIL
jgi:hypothetical protein